MRHNYVWRVDDQITDKDQVEVERARSPHKRSLSSTLALNRLELVQQFLGLDSRPPDHGPVQEERLIANTFRLSFDKRRGSKFIKQ
jgi:hypothetical protein